MEVKVIFRNKKQIHQCCHSFEIRDLSISPRVDLEQYKLKKKKKVGMDMGREGQVVMTTGSESA